MRESVIYPQVLEEEQEEKGRQITLKMLYAVFSVQEVARLTDLSPAAIEELPRQSDRDVR
jgi:predicted transposase YdaD